MTLKQIAEFYNSHGTFSINRVQVYKNGQKVPNRFKYNEVVSVNCNSDATLKKVMEAFPQKILKTKAGFKLTYAGSKAVNLLNEILIYLNPQKREEALILLELSYDKGEKDHSPEAKMFRRGVLKEQLEALKAQNKRNSG